MTKSLWGVYVVVVCRKDKPDANDIPISYHRNWDTATNRLKKEKAENPYAQNPDYSFSIRTINVEE